MSLRPNGDAVSRRRGNINILIHSFTPSFIQHFLVFCGSVIGLNVEMKDDHSQGLSYPWRNIILCRMTKICRYFKNFRGLAFGIVVKILIEMSTCHTRVSRFKY